MEPQPQPQPQPTAPQALPAGDLDGGGFAGLPEDVLSCLFSFLPAYSLRAAAATNRAWRRALQLAPEPLRRRAAWRHCWSMAGAGAAIAAVDRAVCTGGGTWHPGGVAVASSLLLSTQTDAGFRLVVESAAPGDLLMGITQQLPEGDEHEATITSWAGPAPRPA
jgi:hypothetical protein